MKKKSLLSIVLVLLLITSIIIPVSFISFADDEVFGKYRFTSSTGVLEILSDETMIDYSETESINTPWYSYKADIKKVVIADGVTKIGSYCFARMDNLTEVEIADSVTSIGTAALAGNDNLLSISLSNNVISIGENAFGYNREMKVTEDFVCYCYAGSYAQDYCFKNYIPFETAIPNEMQAPVNVQVPGRYSMWSICPSVDTKVTFYSTGGFDTIGFVFDSSNYIYSDNFNVLKASAIVFDDDNGANLNYKISTTLEAGKRYYLSARFSLPSKTGKFNVVFETECVEHTNRINCIYSDDFSFEAINDCVELECEICGKLTYDSFTDAVKDQNTSFDLNNDGIVNAKDYAIILKK